MSPAPGLPLSPTGRRWREEPDEGQRRRCNPVRAEARVAAGTTGCGEILLRNSTYANFRRAIGCKSPTVAGDPQPSPNPPATHVGPAASAAGPQHAGRLRVRRCARTGPPFLPVEPEPQDAREHHDGRKGGGVVKPEMIRSHLAFPRARAGHGRRGFRVADEDAPGRGWHEADCPCLSTKVFRPERKYEQGERSALRLAPLRRRRSGQPVRVTAQAASARLTARRHHCGSAARSSAMDYANAVSHPAAADRAADSAAPTAAAGPTTAAPTAAGPATAASTAAGPATALRRCCFRHCCFRHRSHYSRRCCSRHAAPATAAASAAPPPMPLPASRLDR